MSARFAIPVHTPPSISSPIAQAQKPRLKCQAEAGDRNYRGTERRKTPTDPKTASHTKDD